jgi:hypothetical protein
MKMTIGLLLTEEKSWKEMGLIEFDPSGVLILRGFEGGVHVNALNAVIRLLEGKGLNEPLYEKYADILKREGSLSADLLQKEAELYADVINRLAFHGDWTLDKLIKRGI